MEESKLKVKCQMCGKEWMWGIKNDKNANSFICPDCITHKDITESEPVFILKAIMPNKTSIDYSTQYVDELAEFIRTDLIELIIQEKNK
jgi:late competence protein required for DNA uptake (superfamily II DNA/RNA helicase)